MEQTMKSQERPLSTYEAALRLTRFRLKLYIVNASLWIFMWIAPIATGLIIRELFNGLSGEAPARVGLWGALALLAGTAAGRSIALTLGIFTNHTYLMNIGGLLRKNLLQRILSRPGSDALPGSPGEAISRFRGDIDEIEWATEWFVDLPGILFSTIASLAIMASINLPITLIVFTPMVLIVVLIAMLRTRILRYRTEARRATGRVTGFIAETFGAVQAIKVASAEKNLVQKFGELNEARRVASLKDTTLSEMMQTFFLNTINLGVGVTLLMAGGLLRDGSFTVGDFALFIAYMWPLTDSMFAYGHFIARHNQAKVSLERLNRLMQGAPPRELIRPGPVYLDGTLPDVPLHKRVDGLAPSSNGSRPKQAGWLSGTDRLSHLEVSGLTYHYPGAGRGITGVSFALESGTVTVVTGRIGSGKTTLLRTLLGLLPGEGMICWNDRQVEDPTTFFVPPRAAYTPQVPRLFSERLRDNIMLGQPEDQFDLNGALYTAVFDQDLAHLDDGLDTVVGPRGVRLSGGQIQRAAAARMFVVEPDLLVFDDLSSALDVETEQLLWARIFRQNGRPHWRANGRSNGSSRADTPTCLVVSHRKSVLQQADQIIVLQDGRVQAAGTLDELLTSCEEMQRLWHGKVEHA